MILKVNLLGIFLLLTEILSSQNFNRQEYFESLKQDTIEFHNMLYNRVSSETTKTKMCEKLGNPDSIIAPNYECGGFSDPGQGNKTYQYFYKSLNFIGAGENIILEKVNFILDTTVTLIYKSIAFNHKTIIKEFEQLFPKSYQNRRVEGKEDRIEKLYILPELVSDEMIIFTFKNGCLVTYRYW